MSNKRKLLIFHPALAPYRIDFFNSLNHFFDLIILFERYNVADQKFNQDFLQKCLKARFEYLKYGFTFLGRNIRFTYIFKLYKFKPDIIFCSEYGLNTFFSIIYKTLFNKNVAIYIITDDSINDFISRSYFRKYILKFYFKYISGLITTSENIKSYILNSIKKNIRILIFPIIHNELFFKSSKFENEILNIANFNIINYQLSGKKIVLSVSRLATEKNIESLIRAFNRLNQNDVVLVIVGSGYLEYELKHISKNLLKLDNVIFTGRLEGNSLKAWYALAQIFVLPSIREPFGAVVNEALIFGNFILCSSVAGSICLINDKNGLIFDPTNEFELYTKLLASLDNILPVKLLNKLSPSKMPYNYNEKFNEFYKSI